MYVSNWNPCEYFNCEIHAIRNTISLDELMFNCETCPHGIIRINRCQFNFDSLSNLRAEKRRLQLQMQAKYTKVIKVTEIKEKVKKIK